MTDDQIMAMIQGHEGYEDHVYLDTEDKATCGWGHLLAVGTKVPEAAALAFFDQDFRVASADYLSLMREYNLNLNGVRRAILIDMLFNMGLTRVRRFVLMIKALQNEDWEWAAEEMVDSRWYRQTKTRAKKLVQMMREG
jgi:lysozyme